MTNNENFKQIVARAYAHWCEKKGVFIALEWLKREEITAEQKEEAKKRLEEIQNEKQKTYRKGQDFRLCAMWSNRNDTDFNNYRARADLITPDKKHRFIEFMAYQPRNSEKILFNVDLCNKTMEAEYNEKVAEIREKNKDKNFYSWSDEDREAYEKYSWQPYYWEKKNDLKEFLEWKTATKQTALDLINHLFGTKFENLEILEDLIPCDWQNQSF